MDDLTDAEINLAIATLIAQNEEISDKLDKQTEADALRDKNIRPETGLTPDEIKKVEQTTAIVEKTIKRTRTKKEKPVEEKVKVEKVEKVKPSTKAPPTLKSPTPVKKKVAVKKKTTTPKVVKKTVLPTATVQPTPVKKKVVAKKKAVSKKTTKTAPVAKPINYEKQAEIFSRVFIKLWREKVLEPTAETKIQTKAEENTPTPVPQKQLVAAKPDPIEADKLKRSLLGGDKLSNLIKLGVVGALAAWGFGKELGKMIANIEEKITDISQKQQSSFTKSNLHQYRRMTELAKDPNVTIEKLEKERQFQLDQLQKDREYYQKLRDRESWWLPASLDSDYQAAENQLRQIQKRIDSLERFNNTIKQKREEVGIKQPAPELPDIPISKADTLILTPLASKLNDYIIKNDKIVPFSNKDEVLSFKDNGPINNVLELSRKAFEFKRDIAPTINVAPTPVDFTELIQYFTASVGYLKHIATASDNNNKFLQTIATAKPAKSNTFVNIGGRSIAQSPDISQSQDSRSMYRNSAYSLNPPSIV